MAEFKGTIHIKDGKVDRLENLSDMNQAVCHEGDLSIILPPLFTDGWTLLGDYTLTLTKTEETVEERKSRLVSESKGDARPLSRVSARRKPDGQQCKTCGQFIPEDVLDSHGNCPHCVENSHCGVCGVYAYPLQEGLCTSCSRSLVRD
jgi:hypothetical protein